MFISDKPLYIPPFHMSVLSESEDIDDPEELGEEYSMFIDVLLKSLSLFVCLYKCLCYLKF